MSRKRLHGSHWLPFVPSPDRKRADSLELVFRPVRIRHALQVTTASAMMPGLSNALGGGITIVRECCPETPMGVVHKMEGGGVPTHTAVRYVGVLQRNFHRGYTKKKHIEVCLRQIHFEGTSNRGLQKLGARRIPEHDALGQTRVYHPNFREASRRSRMLRARPWGYWCLLHWPLNRP